jgi:ribosome modulation factor
MTRQKKLIEAGYQAALAGKPCEAPTAKERDRAAWEQGWRAGNAQKARTQTQRQKELAHMKAVDTFADHYRINQKDT